MLIKMTIVLFLLWKRFFWIKKDKSEKRRFSNRLNQFVIPLQLVRMPVDVAKEMIKERGYLNIDPENAWEEWLLYKKYVN